MYRGKVIWIKEKIEEYWNEDNQFKVIIQHVGSINDLVQKKPEKSQEREVLIKFSKRKKIERAPKKNTVCHLYRGKVIWIKEKIEEYWNEGNQFKVVIQHVGSINDLVQKKPERSQEREVLIKFSKRTFTKKEKKLNRISELCTQHIESVTYNNLGGKSERQFSTNLYLIPNARGFEMALLNIVSYNIVQLNLLCEFYQLSHLIEEPSELELL